MRTASTAATNKPHSQVSIVGAGLAGCEAAWQLARRGLRVRLIDLKPVSMSPAHRQETLAELVCSNSLRAKSISNAVGLLKEEMRRLGSLVMSAADRTRVPAGGALAVDRNLFSGTITHFMNSHPLVKIESRCVESVPRDNDAIIATGPLTSGTLASDIENLSDGCLYYFDAIAPVVLADSMDMSKMFRQSRYEKGDTETGDYINAPMDEKQYTRFITALRTAERVQPASFETGRFFEGCLPIEEMAERGFLAPAYGPMKPVGLTDPRTGKRPFAVVQMRSEDAEGTAYNMVGFQTRLKHSEQKKIFSMIPGLENAHFERLGQVHRNTYLNAPSILGPGLEFKPVPRVLVAGQLAGVEGYIESAACGLAAGIFMSDRIKGKGTTSLPPDTTALGGLLKHLRIETENFQPSNVIWSMIAPLPGLKGSKKDKRMKRAQHALNEIEKWKIHIGADDLQLPEASGFLE